MNNPYRDYYEEHFHKESINPALQNRIAQKTFAKPPMMNHLFLRTAFASLGLLLAASFVAPQAFAQTAHAVGSIVTHITRAFDGARDWYSEDDLSTLGADPTLGAIDYTRDDEGEMLKVTKDCGEQADCTLSLPIGTAEDGVVDLSGDSAAITAEVHNSATDSSVTVTTEPRN